MIEYQQFFNTSKPKSTEGIFTHVLQELPIQKTGVAIDLCCGTGKLTSDLAALGYCAFGVDISDSFIGKQSDYAQGFVVADVNFVPFASHQASLVTFIDSLQYFENADVIITEIARLLHHDGYLIMSSQNNYNVAGIKKWIIERSTGKTWSPWLAHPIENSVTYPRILQMLKENGFEIEYVRGKQFMTSWVSLLPSFIRNWSPWQNKPWRSLGSIASRVHFPAIIEEGILARFAMIIFIKARKTERNRNEVIPLDETK